MFGGFGVPNLGDEAILAGLASYYDRHLPNTRLHILTSSPSYSSVIQGSNFQAASYTDALHHWCSEKIVYEAQISGDYQFVINEIFHRKLTENDSSHLRILRAVFDQADAIHVCGGGYFNYGFRYVCRLMRVIAAISAHKKIPMVMSGVTLGPFDEGTDAVAEAICRQCAFIEIRDPRGLSWLKQKGIDAHVCCDDAFLMRLNHRWCSELRPFDGAPTINIQIAGEVLEEVAQAQEILCKLVAGLQKHYCGDLRFRFLQFFPNSPSDHGAAEPAHSFAMDLGAATELLDLSYLNVFHAVTAISHGSITIASRLHGAILSFVAGRVAYTSFFGDSYDRMQHLHKLFGSRNIFSFPSADVDKLLPEIAKHASEKQCRRDSITIRDRADQLAWDKDRLFSCMILPLVANA